MAANLHTSAQATALLRNFFERMFLEALEKNALAYDLATQKVIPANSSDRIDFHRIQRLPKQTIGLSTVMGVAHASLSGPLKGDQYTVDSIVATLELIGNDLEVPELTIISNEPNPMPELSEVFTYNAVQSVDQRIINRCVSGTGSNGSTQTSTLPSVNYNGSSTSPNVVWGDGSETLTEATLNADIPSHRIAATTFNTAKTDLFSNGAMMHPKTPGRYAALISGQLAGDLRMDGTFQDIALKGQQRGENKFESALVGDVFGVHIMESQNVSIGAAGTVDATNDDIHRCIVMGNEYIATINHAKSGRKPIIRYIPPEMSQADLYGTVGWLVWKNYHACEVVNPRAGNVIKAATTRAHQAGSGDDAVWE